MPVARGPKVPSILASGERPFSGQGEPLARRRGHAGNNPRMPGFTGRRGLRYGVAVNTMRVVLLLPFMVAFGVAGHAVLSRLLKVVLWAWSPLATGEPEAATYERRVYHTAVRPMMEVVAAAAASGLLLWAAAVTGSRLAWLAAFAAFAATLLLDVLRWERVAISANNLWFQRGFRGTVHQVAVDNIRDLSVDESEVGGLTLRHGRRNRVVRLSIRMADKRMVALPKTDGHSGQESVEAVANHLRMRLQQQLDRAAARRKAGARDGAGSPPSSAANAQQLRSALGPLHQAAPPELDTPPPA
jgi:hypothetical protein